MPRIIINVTQTSSGSIGEASAVSLGGILSSSLQQKVLVLILGFYCPFIIYRRPTGICMHTYLSKLLVFSDTGTPYLLSAGVAVLFSDLLLPPG